MFNNNTELNQFHFYVARTTIKTNFYNFFKFYFGLGLTLPLNAITIQHGRWVERESHDDGRVILKFVSVLFSLRLRPDCKVESN